MSGNSLGLILQNVIAESSVFSKASYNHSTCRMRWVQKGPSSTYQPIYQRRLLCILTKTPLQGVLPLTHLTFITHCFCLQFLSFRSTEESSISAEPELCTLAERWEQSCLGLLMAGCQWDPQWNSGAGGTMSISMNTWMSECISSLLPGGYYYYLWLSSI